MIHSPFPARGPGATRNPPRSTRCPDTWPGRRTRWPRSSGIRLAADHPRREAMIRSRGLGAVVWSNAAVTAKGAQGVAMSLVAPE